MPWIIVDGIDMMECDYCRLVWDGNAQCNCGGEADDDYNDDYDDGHEDSGYNE
jgi:hypothetical protein